MLRNENSNELRIFRVYDAPLMTVWRAWTDLNEVAKWWGPRGFTITTHSKDFVPGGKWIYTMHGPDGVDYPNITTYYEIVEGSKLVYDHGASEGKEALFKVTVTFTELEGKTYMNMIMAFKDTDTAKNMSGFIKSAGGNGTWDRLGEHLEKRLNEKEVFFINRAFKAPIDSLFNVWIDPNHLKNWMGPRGFKTEFIRADIRENGESYYKMSNGSDVTLYGKAFYKIIKKPHLIVYTQQFSDENENISRHPLAPVWPETKLTTIQFSEVTQEETLVSIKWEIYGVATKEESEAFYNARTGMTGGWTGSLDCLEEYMRII